VPVAQSIEQALPVMAAATATARFGWNSQEYSE
jgi:hypothetical protein